MLAQNFDPHAVTLDQLTDRALLIDARLEAFKPSRSSTSHVTPAKSTSVTTSTATVQSLSRATQERFNKGDPVYMIEANGKAKKGTITSIG
jgi:hypothetical protein